MRTGNSLDGFQDSRGKLLQDQVLPSALSLFSADSNASANVPDTQKQVVLRALSTEFESDGRLEMLKKGREH